MLHAVDKSGKRVAPQKGAEAYCPVCHEQVSAYCGDIYTHHWKHKIDRDCDPWLEPETDWHRDWKNEFPENWQEVVITRNDETHRADIMTDFGLVVEFQNSFISSSDISERETFYRKMIWVINAQAFKGNFRIQSMVSSYLRLSEGENYCMPEPNYEPLRKEVQEIENKISNIQNKIDIKYSDIKHYTQKLENLSNSVRDFLNGRHSLTSSEIRTQYFKLKTSINEKTVEIENCHKTVKFIDGLKKCGIPGLDNFRFVEFANVKPSDFKKCKIIEKNSLESSPLFPTIHEINTEQEFLNYRRYPNRYYLVANVLLSIKAVQNEIDEKTHKLEKFQNELIGIQTEISNALDLEYSLKIETLEKEINSMLDDLGELQMKLSEENSIYLKEVNNLNAKRAEDLKAYQKQKELTRINIMKQYKGYYTYSWKHRRKSWDFSTKIIFLDFETHLFAVLEDNTLKKVSRNELIKQIKDNKFQ